MADNRIRGRIADPATNVANVPECSDGFLSSTLCKVTGAGKYLTATAGSDVNGSADSLTATIPSGYYTGAQQCTMSDADLVAGNIRSGVDVFGVPGTYEVLFGDLATSSANRTYTTPAIPLTTETSTHAGAGATPDLPGTYRPVPRIALDDDGHTPRPAADGGTDTNVAFVDRRGG